MIFTDIFITCVLYVVGQQIFADLAFLINFIIYGVEAFVVYILFIL